MATSADELFNAASWLLGRNAAATPDRVAVTAIDLDGSATDVTYRELDDLAWQAAAALVAAGIRAEERILLCMADSPELLALFLGALYIGAVPVPVSTMATAADLTALASDSRARLLAVSSEFAAAATDAAVNLLREEEGLSHAGRLIREALEGGIFSPDERAGAAAVRAGIGERLVPGEGKRGLRGGAARGEEAVGAGVCEELGAEGVVEKNRAIEGCGEDAVGGVRDGSWLRREAAGAGFVDGDGVLRGLKLRMLEGEDDVGRARGGGRLGEG